MNTVRKKIQKLLADILAFFRTLIQGPLPW